MEMWGDWRILLSKHSITHSLLTISTSPGISQLFWFMHRKYIWKTFSLITQSGVVLSENKRKLSDYDIHDNDTLSFYRIPIKRKVKSETQRDGNTNNNRRRNRNNRNNRNMSYPPSSGMYMMQNQQRSMNYPMTNQPYMMPYMNMYSYPNQMNSSYSYQHKSWSLLVV